MLFVSLWFSAWLSVGAKFLVVLYVFTAGGFSILALTYVHALFAGFAEAQIFTATSVKLIKRIGLFLLMGAALPAPLYAITKLLRYLVVDVPLQNDLLSTFSLNPLWLFLVVAGFSVLVVSRVMESGLELREERDLTI